MNTKSPAIQWCQFWWRAFLRRKIVTWPLLVAGNWGQAISILFCSRRAQPWQKTILRTKVCESLITDIASVPEGYTWLFHLNCRTTCPIHKSYKKLYKLKIMFSGCSFRLHFFETKDDSKKAPLSSLPCATEDSGALVLTRFSRSMASLRSRHGATVSIVSRILQKYLASMKDNTFYSERWPLKREETVSSMNIDYEEPWREGPHIRDAFMLWMWHICNTEHMTTDVGF